MNDEYDWGDIELFGHGWSSPDGQTEYCFEIKDADTDEVVHSGRLPVGRPFKFPNRFLTGEKYHVHFSYCKADPTDVDKPEA